MNHIYYGAEIEKYQSSINSRAKLLAISSIVSAVAASSCCVVPLILVSLGISGTWVGSLTALEQYKPIFLTMTVLALAAGFWQVYFKSKVTCEGNNYCKPLTSGRAVKYELWIATLITLLSTSIDFWAPLFY